MGVLEVLALREICSPAREGIGGGFGLDRIWIVHAPFQPYLSDMLGIFGLIVFNFLILRLNAVFRTICFVNGVRPTPESPKLSNSSQT